MEKAFTVPHHRVTVAGTGVNQIELVEAEPPDVILLDLRLPDQSGLMSIDKSGDDRLLGTAPCGWINNGSTACRSAR
jgi:DNA-binding response OmpR family regulator